MPITERCKNSFLKWKPPTSSSLETARLYRTCTLKKLTLFMRWVTCLPSFMKDRGRFWISCQNQQDWRNWTKYSSLLITCWLNGVMCWGTSMIFCKKTATLSSSTFVTNFMDISKFSKSNKHLRNNSSRPKLTWTRKKREFTACMMWVNGISLRKRLSRFQNKQSMTRQRHSR